MGIRPARKTGCIPEPSKFPFPPPRAILLTAFRDQISLKEGLLLQVLRCSLRVQVAVRLNQRHLPSVNFGIRQVGHFSKLFSVRHACLYFRTYSFQHPATIVFFVSNVQSTSRKASRWKMGEISRWVVWCWFGFGYGLSLFAIYR